MISNLEVMPHPVPTVDKKTAAELLGISPRQFRREVLTYGLRPIQREKRNLLYALTDIDWLKQKRFEALMIERGYQEPAAPKRVVTVKEARRVARKGRR